MIHVHIELAWLRRFPILGVLLGGALAVVPVPLLQSGSSEARILLSQRAPDRVSVHDAVSRPGIRWVTLVKGQWHCDQTVTIEEDDKLDQWLFGKIKTTQVPVTGAVKGEVLVATFDGAIECGKLAGSSLTGVVGSTEIFSSEDAVRRWSRPGTRVAILSAGSSPRSALLLSALLVAIVVFGLAFATYYAWLMFSRTGNSRAN